MSWSAAPDPAPVLERWRELILATYPPDSVRVFRRERDPFANPLGATVRRVTEAVLTAIWTDRELDELALRALDDLVRLRAVQDFRPSEALAFVPLLKQAVRDGWPEGRCPLGAEDLADFDRRVDRVMLASFDLYMANRERIAEIRVRESRRALGKLLERAGIPWNSDRVDLDPDPGSPEAERTT